jgi:Flp pilus assembly protein TadD
LRQASNSLLLEARGARAQGALDRAEALLQRAQRIDPGNATVYLELAGLYAQRGQDGASRAVAERGLLYCRGSDCDDLRKLAAH